MTLFVLIVKPKTNFKFILFVVLFDVVMCDVIFGKQNQVGREYTYTFKAIINVIDVILAISGEVKWL